MAGSGSASSRKKTTRGFCQSRADYFWGWGGDAEAQAGRMKQPLRMWVLWPR